MYPRRTTSRYLRRTTVARPAPAAAPVLNAEMQRRIDIDPAFQVMTSDRQRWIDPFTGRSIPASLGRVAAAREYLLENEGIWKNGQPTLSVARLDYERWRLDLIQWLPNEPRLRVFARDGAWLNPYTGIFVPSITREDGRISLKTVSKIALHLSQLQAARTGKMMEPRQLLELVRLATTKVEASAIAKPLDEAMAKASTVQKKMLPDLPRLDGFALAVHYAAHHGVSGDFYDIITLPDGRVMIVIGDVSGHGMQAALVVATALKTLRFVARSRGELPDILARFNDELRTDLIPGQFITLFAATLDAGRSELRCVRAGHHPGLLINMGKEAMVRRIGKSGMAIGLASGAMFAATLREEIIALQPGDVLLQYTDGLIEAVGSDDSQFGEARLCGSILNHLEMEPQKLVDGIAADVSRWANGPVGDDLTILTLAVTAPSLTETTPSTGSYTQSGQGAARARNIRIASDQIADERADAEDDRMSSPVIGRTVPSSPGVSRDSEHGDDGHAAAGSARAARVKTVDLDEVTLVSDEDIRLPGEDGTPPHAADQSGYTAMVFTPDEEAIEPFCDSEPSETDELEAPAAS